MYCPISDMITTAEQYDWIQLGWWAFWIHNVEVLTKRGHNYNGFSLIRPVWRERPISGGKVQSVYKTTDVQLGAEGSWPHCFGDRP